MESHQKNAKFARQYLRTYVQDLWDASVPAHMRVLLLYRTLYEAHGYKPVYNSSDTMGAVLGISPAGIRQHRRTLVERGLLELVKGGKFGTAYVPVIRNKDEAALARLNGVSGNMEHIWEPRGAKPPARQTVEGDKAKPAGKDEDDLEIPGKGSFYTWPRLESLVASVAKDANLPVSNRLTLMIGKALLDLAPFQWTLDSYDAAEIPAEQSDGLADVAEDVLLPVVDEFKKAKVKKSPLGLFRRILERHAEGWAKFDWSQAPNEAQQPEVVLAPEPTRPPKPTSPGDGRAPLFHLADDPTDALACEIPDEDTTYLVVTTRGDIAYGYKNSGFGPMWASDQLGHGSARPIVARKVTPGYLEALPPERRAELEKYAKDCVQYCAAYEDYKKNKRAYERQREEAVRR
jgi:hypothetical protein